MSGPTSISAVGQTSPTSCPPFTINAPSSIASVLITAVPEDVKSAFRCGGDALESVIIELLLPPPEPWVENLPPDVYDYLLGIGTPVASKFPDPLVESTPVEEHGIVLSAGVIAAIALASIFVAACMIIGAYFLQRYWKRRQLRRHLQLTTGPPSRDPNVQEDFRLKTL